MARGHLLSTHKFVHGRARSTLKTSKLNNKYILASAYSDFGGEASVGTYVVHQHISEFVIMRLGGRVFWSFFSVVAKEKKKKRHDERVAGTFT